MTTVRMPIRIPTALVDRTDSDILTLGRGRVEAMILWSGRMEGGMGFVTTVHAPAQKALEMPDGLCVFVEGPELDRLNRWLYAQEETLLAQIHSHPQRAYHSDTDDRFPIATSEGSLSIVVPFFGSTGLRGPGVVAYQLQKGQWRQSPGHPIGSLIEVI